MVHDAWFQDLDIDIARIPPTLVTKAEEAGFTVKATGRGRYRLGYDIPNEFDSRGYPAHVGIDLHENPSSLRNSIEESSTGINWADPSLLIKDKIHVLSRSSGSRAMKLDSDTEDLMYMAELMANGGAVLPEEYIESLTEEILLQFTKNVDEPFAQLLWDYLPKIGVKLVRIVLYALLEPEPDYKLHVSLRKSWSTLKRFEHRP